MDSFFSGSVQSWLAVAVTTLGPLIALMVGFEGADWFIRRQFGEMYESAPVEAAEGKDDWRRAWSPALIEIRLHSAALMAACFRGIASTPATELVQA
jgi:hypothetical protein